MFCYFTVNTILPFFFWYIYKNKELFSTNLHKPRNINCRNSDFFQWLCIYLFFLKAVTYVVVFYSILFCSILTKLLDNIKMKTSLFTQRLHVKQCSSASEYYLSILLQHMVSVISAVSNTVIGK